MTEFDTSLSVGKLREAELIEFFQSKGHKPIPIPGKFSGFDFFLANTKQGYEVKQDWKAHYSGNLVVEVEMYGKRSGLMATTFSNCSIICSNSPCSSRIKAYPYKASI